MASNVELSLDRDITVEGPKVIPPGPKTYAIMLLWIAVKQVENEVIVRKLNEWAEKNPDCDVILFTNDPALLGEDGVDPPVVPLRPAVHAVGDGGDWHAYPLNVLANEKEIYKEETSVYDMVDLYKLKMLAWALGYEYPLGLKWINIGKSPPSDGEGEELTNPELALALKQFALERTTQFKLQDAFELVGLHPELHPGHFIKSGDYYFQPDVYKYDACMVIDLLNMRPTSFEEEFWFEVYDEKLFVFGDGTPEFANKKQQPIKYVTQDKGKDSLHENWLYAAERSSLSAILAFIQSIPKRQPIFTVSEHIVQRFPLILNVIFNKKDGPD